MNRLSFQVIKCPKTSIVANEYIFNVPDGFQRSISDYGIIFNSSPIFFITRLKPTNINGLFTYMQTLIANQKATGSKIYGPQGIVNLINAMRYNDIGGYKTLPYSVMDQGGQTLLGLKNTEIMDNFINTFQQVCDQSEAVEKIRDLVIDPKDCNDASAHKFIDPIISPIIQNNSVSYIIQTLERKGNVNKDKLAEYKIPSNKMGELMKKGSVIVDDQIISIEQVRNPDIKPFKIIIADIIDELELQQFENQLPKYDQVLVVIHLNEISFQKYKDFLKSYQCEHLLAAYTQPSNFQFSHEIICNKLNQQYPHNFPQIIRQFAQIPDEFKQYLMHQDMMEFVVLPIKNQGYQQKQVIKQDFNNNIQQVMHNQAQQQKIIDNQNKLIFLGTSSMKPGKYRNVSGILIQSENYNIILDCGEGTYKQIIDHQINLQKPLIIWISHSHSDHHMGLFELVNNLKDELIYLIVPAIMVPWITYYQESIQEIFNIKIILSQQLEPENLVLIDDLIKESFYQQRIRQGPKLNDKCNYKFVENLEELKKNFKNQIINIQTVQVDHCPQSYGIKFHFIDGNILTYSGDTRPCQAFQDLSQDSTLFIHEATFSNDLQENALNNKHSTIQEAIDIGRNAKSETIILTHFSQRMAKGLEGIEEYLDQNVVFACDHLSASFDEFKNIGNMSIEISKSLGDN